MRSLPVAVALALGALTAVLAGDAVESGWVGTWQASVPDPKNKAVTWSFTMTVAADGHFTLDTKVGGKALPRGEGQLEARDGTWKSTPKAGAPDSGTYKFVNSSLELTYKSNGKTLLWGRADAPPRKEDPAPKKEDPAPKKEDPAPKKDGAPPPPAPPTKREAPTTRVEVADGLPVPKPATLTAPEPLNATGALYLDAIDALEEGRYGDAQKLYEQILVELKDNANAFYGRTVALLGAEKLDLFVRAIEDASERMLRDDSFHCDEDLELRRLIAIGLYARSSKRTMAMLMRFNSAFPRDEYETRLARVAQAFGTGNEKQKIELRAALPGLIARFAVSRRLNDPVAKMVYARGCARQEKKDDAGASLDFERVIKAHPYHWSAMGRRSWSLIRLGAFEPARGLATELLIYMPAVAEGYLARALAAARQGDLPRVEADLAVAEKLDPKATAAFRNDHAAELAASPAPRGDAAKLLEELLAAARSGASADALVEKAVAIRRIMAVSRLRYDESFQEQRRRVEWACSADMENPDLCAKWARLWQRNLEPPGEAFELDCGVRWYRPFERRLQSMEESWAEQFFGKALAKNPTHLLALLGKTGVAVRKKDFDGAEKLLAQVMRIAPDLPETLELAYEIHHHASQAAAWRSVQLRSWRSVETIHEVYVNGMRRSGNDFSTWSMEPPTEEMMNQSAEEDAREERLAALANAQLRRAAQSAKGTPAGSYWAGLLARREGRTQDALAAFQESVKVEPRSPRSWRELAEVAFECSRSDVGVDALDRSLNLQHTTAAAWLQAASAAIGARDPGAVRRYLAVATERDPADARVPTYFALAAECEKNRAETAACCRAALAVEEARARDFGGTFRAGGRRPFLPLRELGLTLRLRILLGDVLILAGQPEAALAAFRENTALESASVDVGTDMDSGVLPLEIVTTTFRFCEPTFLGGLYARSRWGSGRALAALGRAEAARSELEPAVAFIDRIVDGEFQSTNPLCYRASLKTADLAAFLAETRAKLAK